MCQPISFSRQWCKRSFFFFPPGRGRLSKEAVVHGGKLGQWWLAVLLSSFLPSLLVPVQNSRSSSNLSHPLSNLQPSQPSPPVARSSSSTTGYSWPTSLFFPYRLSFATYGPPLSFAFDFPGVFLFLNFPARRQHIFGPLSPFVS